MQPPPQQYGSAQPPNLYGQPPQPYGQQPPTQQYGSAQPPLHGQPPQQPYGQPPQQYGQPPQPYGQKPPLGTPQGLQAPQPNASANQPPKPHGATLQQQNVGSSKVYYQLGKRIGLSPEEVDRAVEKFHACDVDRSGSIELPELEQILGK